MEMEGRDRSNEVVYSHQSTDGRNFLAFGPRVESHGDLVFAIKVASGVDPNDWENFNATVVLGAHGTWLELRRGEFLPKNVGEDLVKMAEAFRRDPVNISIYEAIAGFAMMTIDVIEDDLEWAEPELSHS